MKEIIFTKQTSEESDKGLVDGGCFIEKDLWPQQNGGYLFHLLSMPAKWLIKTNNEKWVSIFVPYDKEEFSHYSKMSSYELEHKDSFVVLHDQTVKNLKLNSDQSNNSGQFLLKKHVEETLPDVASYIGGEPNWVQDKISLLGYHWALSIYGPDIDDALIENAGILSGGTLHVFLKNQIDFDNDGVIGKTFFEL